MKERIVIIFIAVTLGLLATTVAFFLYESAKPAKIAENPKPTPSSTRTAQNADSFLLVINEPKDESITNKRSLQVKGKTNPDNIVIISSNSEDITVRPTEDGEFNATITIAAGVNKLITTAINTDGDAKTDTKIVSFSAEEF